MFFTKPKTPIKNIIVNCDGCPRISTRDSFYTKKSCFVACRDLVMDSDRCFPYKRLRSNFSVELLITLNIWIKTWFWAPGLKEGWVSNQMYCLDWCICLQIFFIWLRCFLSLWKIFNSTNDLHNQSKAFIPEAQKKVVLENNLDMRCFLNSLNASMLLESLFKGNFEWTWDDMRKFESSAWLKILNF